MKGAESSGVACKWQTKGVRVERVGVSAYGRVGVWACRRMGVSARIPIGIATRQRKVPRIRAANGWDLCD